MDPNPAGFPAAQRNRGYPLQPSQPAQRSFPLQLGPGGAMIPSGFPPSSGPHANFSAPFAQPPAPTAVGQFSSPQTSAATSTSHPPPSAAHSLPQNMASVPANNDMPTGPPRPSHQSSSSQGGAQTPAQAQAAAREKARVSTLLEINSMLLQEVVNLQTAGKAGAPPAQQGSHDASSSTPDQSSEGNKNPAQKPSPEYIECMRRLQANLAYLAAIADRTKKSGGVAPSSPAIMTPPPNIPWMNEVYGKLSDLFLRTGAAAGGTPQPNPQAMQDNGNPSPSPGAESAV
ncbi:hypothetical protein PHISP_02194 [Aspergillus sp. HF37]|nr:hypothetical protein PHISP_02194 [Aspergillus sp. HF37]